MSRKEPLVSLMLRLQNMGCKIWAEDDKLRIRASKNALNSELKQEIQHLSTQLASNQPEMQREMQVETDIHDIKQDNLHTPSPPPPHLSPVNTDDVIRSVKRRLWRKTPSPRTPRTRNRRRANANRGGANKSCKL